MKTVLAFVMASALAGCVDRPIGAQSEVMQVGYVDCDGGVPDSGTWAEAPVTADRR